MHERQQAGDFVPVRHHDALSTALGKPDHSGRCRGYEKGTSIRTVFGNPTEPRSSFSSSQSLEQLKAEWTVQITQQLEAKFQQEQAALRAQMESQTTLTQKLQADMERMMAMMSSFGLASGFQEFTTGATASVAPLPHSSHDSSADPFMGMNVLV